MKIFYLLLAFIIVATSSCSVSKTKHYAYNINTYALAPEKNLMSVASLVSYKDYLFEFIMQVNISDTVTDGQPETKSGITYTPKQVYVLKNKTDSFFLFDQFSLNNQLVKTGTISQKEWGIKFRSYTNPQASNSALYKSKPKDTIINNVNCYYVDLDLSVLKLDTSAYAQTIFLYKDKNFTSFYKLWNATYADKKFGIIGMHFFDKINKQGFAEEPDKLRVLTKEEEQICEAMIRKIRL